MSTNRPKSKSLAKQRLSPQPSESARSRLTTQHWKIPVAKASSWFRKQRRKLQAEISGRRTLSRARLRFSARILFPGPWW